MILMCVTSFAMKYHDNDIMLRFDGFTICEGTFTIKSYSIAKGQDPDECISVGKVITIGTNGKLTLRVGRMGSREVAQWWKANIPASCTTFNSDPAELNFAVIGDLRIKLMNADGNTFTMVAEDAAFAQGKSGTSNNYWFGGKNMTHCEDNKVMVTVCTQGEDVYYFRATRGGNDVNEVFFDTVNKRSIKLDGWLDNFPDLPIPSDDPERPDPDIPSDDDVKDQLPEEMQNPPFPPNRPGDNNDDNTHTTHTYSSSYTIDVQPTCMQSGSKSRHCTYSGCTAKTDVTSIATTDHNFSGTYSVDQAATCFQNGSKSRHCTYSGCTAKTDVTTIAATDHKFSSSYTTDVQPTCTQPGSKSRHCVWGCTAKTDVTSIAATGHSYDGKKLTATAGTDGLYAYVCDNGCGTNEDHHIIKDFNGTGTTLELTKNGSRYEAGAVTLADGKPFQTPVDFTAASIIYSRSMSNEWGSLVVPFGVAPSGAGYELYGLTKCEGDVLTISKIEAAVPAGTPVIVRMIDGKTTLTLSAVSASVTGHLLGGSAADGLQLTGAYANANLTGKSGYILDGDSFVSLDGKEVVSLAPFRAYLAGVLEGGAKQLMIKIKGEEVKFNISDVNTIVSLLQGASWTAEQLDRYDFNGDGKLSIDDLAVLIKKLNE